MKKLIVELIRTPDARCERCEHTREEHDRRTLVCEQCDDGHRFEGRVGFLAFGGRA